MTEVRREITADTVVVVTMQGEKGGYQFVQPYPLGSMVNTLSDLTGYTSAHILDALTRELAVSYGATVRTAAGVVCPIKFLVTLESRKDSDNG